MDRRLELQALLETLLGKRNVYFQPTNNVNMNYPAIVYQRDYMQDANANNARYLHKKRYMVTVIDRNPDSEIPDRVGALPLCAFVRFFTKDNLNHDIYNLYF